MSREEIARLFRQYKRGDAVRAIRSIYWAADDVEVPEGSTGIVEEPSWGRTTGIVLVHWPMIDRSLPTSKENVEPVGGVS